MSVWGNGSDQIERRYQQVTIVIDQQSYPMWLQHQQPGQGTWMHVIPAGNYPAGSAVPYVIRYTFDGYDRSTSGMVEYDHGAE